MKYCTFTVKIPITCESLTFSQSSLLFTQSNLISSIKLAKTNCFCFGFNLLRLLDIFLNRVKTSLKSITHSLLSFVFRELNDFIWNEKTKNSTIKSNLDKLNKLTLITNTKEKKYIKETKLIDIEFKKEWSTLFRFKLFPSIRRDCSTNIIFTLAISHYVNVWITDLIISNNKIIDFFTYISFQLLFLSQKSELYVENKELDKYWFNKNVTLRKQLLTKIWEITNSFTVIKEQKWFVFYKKWKACKINQKK